MPCDINQRDIQAGWLTRARKGAQKTNCSEVAEVYPELMIRDESGRIDGVRYDELAPMLLNEVQQQQRKIAAQDEQNAVEAAEIRDLTRRQKQLAIQEMQLRDVQRQLALMQAALAKLDGQ
jgi:hypothetical protein